MKTPLLAAALLCALAIAGCNSAGSRLTAARDWVNDPKTQAAASTIAGWDRAIICKIPAGAALAGQIEDALSTGYAVKTTTGRVYTVSAAVCSAIGGVAGATVAPAAAK
jgi:hypothetical protein